MWSFGESDQRNPRYNRVLMTLDKQRICAKLRLASHELEDVLNLSAVPLWSEPIVIPEARRNELKAMLDDLQRIVAEIEAE